MPKMVDMEIVLDGNGPKKRRGMHDLVRKLRADVAEEQNAELERAGVEKRYDPRSYRAQGIELESTTHHGASRSALEASGRGALHWSAKASREWDRITQSVESYLEVEHVGPVDVERVREVLEELRFEAGTDRVRRKPGTPPKSSVTKNAADATWCVSIRARPNANASIVPKP